MDKIYNIDKVIDKIGLKDQIEYNKIDVFLDAGNQNNVWAIVHFTDLSSKQPKNMQVNVRFSNYREMINYIHSHFGTYELNHQVNYLEKKIFFHSVDYLKIEYYLHENKPKLNYIELTYKEYVNNDYHIRKLSFPKEEEKTLEEIIKINKKIPLNSKLPNEIHKTIDVYSKRQKRMDKDRDIEKTSKNTHKSKKTRIRNLKPFVSTIVLTTIIASGYTIVKENIYKEEIDIVTQDNTSLNVKDLKIRHNEERVGLIVEQLMDNNYDSITQDNLKYIVDYFKTVESSNYDRNRSTSRVNYIEYFSNKLFNNNHSMSIDESRMVLGKIETLYNKCFVSMGKEVFINQSIVNEYIDYVASLTFMYDTTVDSRGSNLVQMEQLDSSGLYAKKQEIAQYNKYPLILKYIILNQLKSMLIHSDYQVKVKPSNYFQGLDRIDLTNIVTDKIESIYDELKHQCHGSKSI